MAVVAAEVAVATGAAAATKEVTAETLLAVEIWAAAAVVAAGGTEATVTAFHNTAHSLTVS